MVSQVIKEDTQSKTTFTATATTVIANGKTEEAMPVSRLREVVPQFFAVSAQNLLLFTFGSSLGFPTILIPELEKHEPDITATLDEVTWIGSINLFLVPLGAIVSGPVSQRIGRRRTMMLVTIPFIFAWLIFHYAQNTAMLFAAQALTGITGGFLEAPVLTYVAEVTQPQWRGLLSATSTMAVIVGIFSQMLTGSLVDWRTVTLINLVYPVLSFTVLYMVPESPMWLADKGRFCEAEKALCWLRGWVTPKHVEAEFRELRKALQRPATVVTIDSIIIEQNDNRIKQDLPLKRLWHSYLKRTFYKPFALVTWLFWINAFGGHMVLQVFALVILEDLKTPIDKYQATVIVGVAQVIGTIVCIFMIHFTGKRKITFFSVFTTGVTLLLIAVHGFLILYDRIDPVEYAWIPTTLMVVAAFCSHVSLKAVPWILIGEVFPQDVRSVATGAAGAIGYILTSIANKMFLYMKIDMTLPGTFLFYAAMNFLGVIGLYFTMPETENRTLKEIEDHFAGLHKLKSMQRKRKVEKTIREKWSTASPQLINEDLESRL